MKEKKLKDIFLMEKSSKKTYGRDTVVNEGYKNIHPHQ
jgi:hypothetical protein